MATTHFTLPIIVGQIGSRYIAGTKIGGYNIQGKGATDAETAVRNLFFALQQDDDNATFGISLAIAGQTLNEVMGELLSGPTEPTA